METIGTWWMWVAFVAVVLVMLAVDLRGGPVSLNTGSGFISGFRASE